MRLNTCEVQKEECDVVLSNPWLGPDANGRYLLGMCPSRLYTWIGPDEYGYDHWVPLKCGASQ